MISNDTKKDILRFRVGLFSVALSVALSFFFSHWEGSDGRTAAMVAFVNLSLFAWLALRQTDRELVRLLVAGASFGLVELLADFLCVRSTRTLDYSPAHSWLLLESPWWMPLSWAVVAVQVGLLGERAIRRWGKRRGALLTGALSAVLIPGYEELAYGAHWWRYVRCWQVGHTPVYIVVAEALIGAALAFLGFFALRARSPMHAFGFGAVAGLATLGGGLGRLESPSAAEPPDGDSGAETKAILADQAPRRNEDKTAVFYA